MPYGSAAQQAFPAFIDRINADPDVRMVSHLGDIKNGSSECSDGLYAQVRPDFNLFRDPLVYTPGDNEWTDCHRPADGRYNPLERLGTLRDVFFERPGTTLGQHAVAVRSQAVLGFPENVRYVHAGVSFATLHVVGSNDDLAPWSGLGNASPTKAQVREEKARMAAAVDNEHAPRRC